jgi:hypothetical protein
MEVAQQLQIEERSKSLLTHQACICMVRLSGLILKKMN